MTAPQSTPQFATAGQSAKVEAAMSTASADVAPEGVAPAGVAPAGIAATQNVAKDLLAAQAQERPHLAPDPDVERPMRRSMLRGWHRRCPQCGAGPMLRGFLTVRDHCPVCSEPLHHHRADDGPAYLTILIVGHVIAPLILWSFITFRPDPLALASVFSVGAVALSLYLLPRLKGALVAIQWARRMHGFATASR